MAATGYTVYFKNADTGILITDTIDFGWKSFDGVWSINVYTESTDWTTTNSGTLRIEVNDEDFQAQGCDPPYRLLSDWENIRVSGQYLTDANPQWSFYGTGNTPTSSDVAMAPDGETTIYLKKNVVPNTYTVTFNYNGSKATDANGTMTTSVGTASISSGSATITSTATTITVTKATFTSTYADWSGTLTLSSTSQSGTANITKKAADTIKVYGQVTTYRDNFYPTVKITSLPQVASAITSKDNGNFVLEYNAHSVDLVTLTFSGYGYETTTAKVQLTGSDIHNVNVKLTSTKRVSSWNRLADYVKNTLGFSLTKPSVITDGTKCLRPTTEIINAISSSSSDCNISVNREHTETNRDILESDWQFAQKASAGSISMSASSTTPSSDGQALRITATLTAVSAVTYSDDSSWLEGYDDGSCSTKFTTKHASGIATSNITFYVKCDENTSTSSRTGTFTLTGKDGLGNTVTSTISVTQAGAGTPMIDYDNNLFITGGTDFLEDLEWDIPYTYSRSGSVPKQTEVMVKWTFTQNGEEKETGSYTIIFPSGSTSGGANLHYNFESDPGTVEFLNFYYKRPTDTKWSPSSADFLLLYEDTAQSYRIYVDWEEV